MTDTTKHVLLGSAFALAGLLIAAEVYWLPERLEAPAWVVYAAASAFSLAGLSVVAQTMALRRAGGWLAGAVMGALVVVAMWMAFGAGARPCSISVGFFTWLGSEILCRGVLGAGAVMAAVVLICIVMRTLPGQNAE